MNTKLCKTCDTHKPYHKHAKGKARGFVGAACWACYKEAHKVAMRSLRATPKGLEATRAASVRSLVKRLKTDSWFRLKVKLTSETNRVMKQLAVGGGTDETCIKLFGQPREVCLAHFSEQLDKREFLWNDHGQGWVVDHRVPLGLAQNDLELRTLALLENCDVLTPTENRIKAISDIALIRVSQA